MEITILIASPWAIGTVVRGLPNNVNIAHLLLALVKKERYSNINA